MSGKWPLRRLQMTGCPVVSSFRPGQLDNECDLFHFWSLHPSGANFMMADGSVHFLAYSANDILPALASRAGGEPVWPSRGEWPGAVPATKSEPRTPTAHTTPRRWRGGLPSSSTFANSRVVAVRCCGGTHRLAAEAQLEKHCSHRISAFGPILPLEPADSREPVESVAAVA